MPFVFPVSANYHAKMYLLLQCFQVIKGLVLTDLIFCVLVDKIPYIECSLKGTCHDSNNGTDFYLMVQTQGLTS